MRSVIQDAVESWTAVIANKKNVIAISLLLIPVAIAILVFFPVEPTGPSSTRFGLRITTVDGRPRLDPPLIRANQSDQIILRIESDDDGRFHVHGYDIEVDVGPLRGVQILTFNASRPGRHDLEFHFPPPEGEVNWGGMVIGSLEVNPKNRPN